MVAPGPARVGRAPMTKHAENPRKLTMRPVSAAVPNHVPGPQRLDFALLFPAAKPEEAPRPTECSPRRGYVRPTINRSATVTGVTSLPPSGPPARACGRARHCPVSIAALAWGPGDDRHKPGSPGFSVSSHADQACTLRTSHPARPIPRAWNPESSPRRPQPGAIRSTCRRHRIPAATAERRQTPRVAPPRPAAQRAAGCAG